MSGGKLLFLRYQKKLLSLLVAANKLLSVQVYEENAPSLVGNIYIGKVQSIAANINAAFVEIAEKQLCFLPLADIKAPHMVKGHFQGKLKAGDELVVQVARDAVKTKQPVLTTKISIAGTYLAVSDVSAKLGLSNKLGKAKKEQIIDFLMQEGLVNEAHTCLAVCDEDVVEDRASVKDDMTDNTSDMTVSVPMEDMGMVVRTNAGTLEDFSLLKKEWILLQNYLHTLLASAVHRTCFSCLYKSETPYLAELKNLYQNEYEEIITDCKDVYEELCRYQKTNPGSLQAVRFYEDAYPLEKLYSVKTLLDGALQSRVWLKSGGYLVIEPTEALTVIDVNTGKCEAGKHSEDTFYKINKEAADEIALQLRLRNLSGIIIVDFINMVSEEKQKELLTHLAALVKKDAVKTSVIDMTPLGLVEITRKRINRPLRELL